MTAALKCPWCVDGCRACHGRGFFALAGDATSSARSFAETVTPAEYDELLASSAAPVAKLVPVAILARLGELAKLLAAPTNSDALSELLDLVNEVAP